MDVKRKTEVYLVCILLLVGISLVVYFFYERNYFDLAYGCLLIVYGIRLYYVRYKKIKEYLSR